MRKLLKELLHDENGDAIIIMTPCMLIVAMMLMMMVLSMQQWLYQKRQIQVAADSASLAGTLAVEKDVIYRFQTGRGKESYHVATYLNESEANENARRVFEEHEKYFVHNTVTNVQYNPSYTVPLTVWNKKTHVYETKYETSLEQYRNGCETLVVDGTVRGIFEDLIGQSSDVHKVNIVSQSQIFGDVSRVK